MTASLSHGVLHPNLPHITVPDYIHKQKGLRLESDIYKECKYVERRDLKISQKKKTGKLIKPIISNPIVGVL